MKTAEIKALRERLHLTQKQFAEAVGVQPNTVARWERGESNPSVAMVQRLESVAEGHPSGNAIVRSSSVLLDPHHGNILKALQDRLDPDVFQACAVALLQRDYPGLVAVNGPGGDDGFDGAISDVIPGQPYPLIATVGYQSVQNLTKNMDQARRKGWELNRAIFATSRRITPNTRRKLFTAARDRHVDLKQIYDQDWFAGRLYHEPEWCKRLLGVGGRPHALSVFPITQRPDLGDQVLGREQEMQWLLNNRRGDCLLVGEPGSGKTFLLRSLALQGKARFLVDSNREQIANDLRSLQPAAVIVDDAHVHMEWMTELMQIRREVRSDFRIIAVSWPGEASAVRNTLQISLENQYELGRVDAGTMVEIIKSAGIAGPDELLREIRRQAVGRPGLAVTLVHLCLVGDIKNVVSGESLVDQMESSFRSIIGDDSLILLAPFALGGDAGITKDRVAEGLGIPIKEVAEKLAKLATSGVVVEIPESLSTETSSNWPLSVMPPRMRGALVRRIFYGGPSSLPIDRFLPAARNPLDALKTLIEARACGAPLPELELRLKETNHASLWLKYAFLGKREVSFVLDCYPDLILQLAEPALLYVPERAVPMLLFEAAKDTRSDSSWNWNLPSSSCKKVLDTLERWISEDSIDKEGLLARRATLIRAARKWWQCSRNTDVALSAMCIALNPVYRFSRIDPGLGTTVTLIERALSAELVDELAALWSLASDVVGQSVDLPWTALFAFMEKFWHPRPPVNQNVGKRYMQRIVNDLSNASRKHPGIQRRIGQFAGRFGVEFDEASDSVFECLYPRPQERLDVGNLDRERLVHLKKVEALAASWDHLAVDDIVCHLAKAEDEAILASISYPRLSAELCRMLARRCSNPIAYAKALMARRLPADLVDPFVRCAIAGDRASWSIVEDCLNDETYKYVGIAVALADSGAPPEIVSSAVAQAKGAGQFVEHICLRREVSEAALLELFRAEDEGVAVAAGIGHWGGSQSRDGGALLGTAWREAILRSAEGDAADSEHHRYWISQIMEQDDELAVEWLIRRVSRKSDSYAYHLEMIAIQCTATLEEDQRRNVLRLLPSSQRTWPLERELVSVLVGDYSRLYQELLNSKDLASLHLAPLVGKPTQGWETKAVLALDYGYSVDEIVDATQNTTNSGTGSESATWAEWRSAFERLRDDTDPRVVRIGEQGSQMILDRERKVKERKRHEEIYGR